MTNITKAAQDALEALEEIALAGMSGSCQESEEGMRDWHARQAWKFIGIAARALDPIRAALQDKAGEVPDDVARYRAIRDGLVYIEPHESGEIYVAGETGVYTKSGDEFDAAIDAIAASQQKG